MIKSALSLFTNLYAIWVIGASIAAFIVPELFLWFSGPWITWALAIIMLGMGLTLSVEDFRKIWIMPRPVALGFVFQYTLMPLIAWSIAHVMNLEAPFAVGLILVACCPGGTASNVVAFLAKANVALSVTLTMVSTLLAIVMTPMLMQYWAGEYVPIDGWGIFRTTLQVVLIPVVLGVYLNHRFPKVGEAASHIGPAVAVFAIVMIAGSIVAGNVEAIVGQGIRLATAGFLLHSVGFAVGYWFTRMFKYPQIIARTVSIEVGMQNSGLAMVLAHQHFIAATATPAVFSSVFHTLVGSLCAAYWRLKPPREEKIKHADRRNIYYWKCDRPASFHGIKRKDRDHQAELVAAKLKPILIQHLGESDLKIERGRGRGDHLTFQVKNSERSYFVRVQDGPEEDDYMEVVSEIIEKVRIQTEVPVPQVLVADSTRQKVPFAFQIIEYLPYQDLNHLYKAKELSLLEIANKIGIDVARWQSIQLDGFGLFNQRAFRKQGKITGVHESYERYFLLNWDHHLKFLESRGFLSLEEMEKLRSVVKANAHHLNLEQGCLVHKDLALWNMLGTRNEVKAYIDWDDTISGDPTDDLSLLACFHDGEFITEVIEGYQSVRMLPADFSARFWLHLLRNMIVKAMIRVESGYFKANSDLFIVPPGGSGKSLEIITREKIWLAYAGLRDRKDVLELSILDKL